MGDDFLSVGWSFQFFTIKRDSACSRFLFSQIFSNGLIVYQCALCRRDIGCADEGIFCRWLDCSSDEYDRHRYSKRCKQERTCLCERRAECFRSFCRRRHRCQEARSTGISRRLGSSPWRKWYVGICWEEQEAKQRGLHSVEWRQWAAPWIREWMQPTPWTQ